MIIDGILFIFQGVLSVILLPLEGLNIAVDFISSMSIVVTFLEIIAYVLPWSNLLPLIFLTISIFSFRIGLSLVKTIWNFIPFV